MENMSTERLHSRLNTKQNWSAIVPFTCEQPICPFQKAGLQSMAFWGEISGVQRHIARCAGVPVCRCAGVHKQMF